MEYLLSEKMCWVQSIRTNEHLMIVAKYIESIRVLYINENINRD